jgi:hypothetical protein
VVLVHHYVRESQAGHHYERACPEPGGGQKSIPVELAEVPRRLDSIRAPSPPDALVSAKLQLAEADAVAIARAERIIADAQTTARDIIAEAERAAQDLVARAIKIQAEADRALDLGMAL